MSYYFFYVFQHCLWDITPYNCIDGCVSKWCATPTFRVETFCLKNLWWQLSPNCWCLCTKYSGVCYNKRCCNERMLQRTVFINKIRMLQRTQMLQRTRRNTIGRCSTRVRMTCQAFPLWLERQSSSLLSFVRFDYQFISVTCCLCFY